MPTPAKARNNKYIGNLDFLYPDGGPDQFENLMESKLDKDHIF